MRGTETISISRLGSKNPRLLSVSELRTYNLSRRMSIHLIHEIIYRLVVMRKYWLMETRCSADKTGNYFRSGSSRPSDILTPIWRNVKRSNEKKHQRWISEFSKIIDGKADILATTHVEENRLDLEKLRDADLRKAKEKDLAFKRKKKHFANLPMGSDSKPTSTPTATDTIVEAPKTTVTDTAHQETSSGKFKFKRVDSPAAVETVPIMVPDENSQDLFGDEGAIKWINEGRQKPPAKMALAVIALDDRYDLSELDQTEQTMDVGGSVYEVSFERDLNASIAKYTPYLYCEDNSSRGVRFVG